MDWVDKGAVTPVKQAGQCGCSGAITLTESLEGAWEIATGVLESLSEQQLADVSGIDPQGCGCDGFNWEPDLSHVNLCAGGTYPGNCSVAIPSGAITGYKDVPDEAALLSAVQAQPVSAYIEADQYSFQAYTSGVLTGSCGTNVDHAVLVVGFGTDSGVDYWKVKNSWGPTWGENGYIRIERGSNKCGIGTEATYPTVAGSDQTIIV